MAIINVGLTIVLCQRYGSVGAAVGTAISLVLANGITMNIYYYGNTAQLRQRISADLLHHFCSFKNGKYIQYSPVFETLNWHKISR